MKIPSEFQRTKSKSSHGALQPCPSRWRHAEADCGDRRGIRRLPCACGAKAEAAAALLSISHGFCCRGPAFGFECVRASLLLPFHGCATHLKMWCPVQAYHTSRSTAAQPHPLSDLRRKSLILVKFSVQPPARLRLPIAQPRAVLMHWAMSTGRAAQVGAAARAPRRPSRPLPTVEQTFLPMVSIILR